MIVILQINWIKLGRDEVHKNIQHDKGRVGLSTSSYFTVILNTPDWRQLKTHLTINEHRSKMDRNSRQMAIKNSVSSNF